MVSHEKPEGILLTYFRKPQAKLQDMLLEGLKIHTPVLSLTTLEQRTFP